MHERNRRLVLRATCAIGLACPVPVQAQAWIGEMVGNMMAASAARAREHACMMGEAPPAKEIDEVRAPAEQAIAEYWRAAAGGGPRDITPVFKSDNDAAWIDGATRLNRKQMTAVTDRFAGTSGASLDTKPQWFIRTSDLADVRGVWLVRDRSGMPIGAYSAAFRRNLGTWHLRSVILLPGDPAPVAPAQYCHKEGDVAPYQVAFAESERQRAERRAEKERRRQERAARATTSRR